MLQTPTRPLGNALRAVLIAFAVVCGLGCGEVETGARGSGSPGSGGSGGSAGDASAGARAGAGGGERDGAAPDGDARGPSCAETNCHALATCDDSSGTAVCRCIAGYEGDGIQSCIDKDECTLGTADCAAVATCTNTEGGFTCTCPAGYTGDGKTCSDVDECAPGGTNDCHPNALCTNTPGSFSCACKQGFTGDGRGCADINECLGAHGCPTGTVCMNIAGSFQCDCAAGFELKNGVCTDKCVVAKAERCDPVSTCQIVANAARCTCPSTHSDPNGDGSVCTANPTCQSTCTSPNTVCIVVSPTQVRCECRPGFSGNGTTCVDINECTAGTHGCSPNANCTNSIGGFSCACKTGYAGNGIVCNNIDECTNGTHTCDPNATCTDATPGFNCACKPGYAGNGFSCTNINECTAGTHNCHADANCTDSTPGFSCACKPGFVGNGTTTCNDIDECAANTDNCHANATCTNSPRGSFTCTCNQGYAGNGTTICTNVNECTAGTHNCDPNATCTDSTPGFSCACKLGYTGNGQTCTFQFCDLGGTWATRAEITSTWNDYLLEIPPAQPIVILQGGTFTAIGWELRRFTYNGTTLTQEIRPCGGTYPDALNPFINEVYGAYVPNSTSDNMPYLATFSHSVPNAVANSPFVTPMRGALLGVQLADPLGTGPWPTRNQINSICGAPGATKPCWSNDDNDNFPAFTSWSRPPTQTSTIYGGRNYKYPPSAPQVVITKRVACQSLGLRTLHRLNGKVVNCNTIGGAMEANPSEAHLHSCRMAPNHNNEVDCTTNKDKVTGQDLVPCLAADEADLDNRIDDVVFTVTNAKFVMVRVPDTTTCPTVRSTTFPVIAP